MQTCMYFNIEVPDSFPLSAWEDFYNLGKQATSGVSDAQEEFIRAMGCITYRFRTCYESINSMIGDWQKNGGTLSREGRYTIQRDLFTFFTCSLSSIESLLYAIYVVATQRFPLVLDWSNLTDRKWKTDPNKISSTLKLAYTSSHQIITEIENLFGTQTWKDWNAFRVCVPNKFSISVMI